MKLLAKIKALGRGYDLSTYQSALHNPNNYCKVCGAPLTHTDGRSLIHAECKHLGVYGAEAAWAWEHSE